VSDVVKWPVTKIAEAIRSRKISCAEVVGIPHRTHTSMDESLSPVWLGGACAKSHAVTAIVDSELAVVSVDFPGSRSHRVGRTVNAPGSSSALDLQS
jgi:hypothetical protein